MFEKTFSEGSRRSISNSRGPATKNALVSCLLVFLVTFLGSPWSARGEVHPFAEDLNLIPHVIFRTAQPVSTGLGGLSAMDDRCQSKAHVAGLRGTWIALLSDSTVNARQRLESRGVPGPFYNAYRSGQEVADNVEELFGEKLNATLIFNEFGNTSATDSAAWTATSADGSYAGSSYDDWTSFSGRAKVGRQLSTDSKWLDWIERSGVQSANLYCVRVDLDPPLGVSALPRPTHRIFVTSQDFDGDLGGLAGADEKCQERAAAASLGGDWMAILSDSQTDARDRLSLAGPIYNTAGQLVANSLEDLFDGGIAAYVRSDEEGNPVGDRRVWTGSRPDGRRYSAAGPSAYKDDWTSSSGRVEIGWTTDRGAGWLDKAYSFAFGNPSRLNCIEVCSDSGQWPTALSEESASCPLEVKIAGNEVYWTDPCAGTVNKKSVAGGGETVLVSGVTSLRGLAVSDEDVFFVGACSGHILMVSRGGGAVSVLADGQTRPSGLAVNGSHLFWTNEGDGPGTGAVLRQQLAGGGPETIVTGLDTPSRIAAGERSVCWTEPGAQSVRCSLPDGGAVTPAIFAGEPRGIAIDILNRVVWTDGADNSVHRASAADGIAEPPLATGLANPWGIACDDPSLVWAESDAGVIQRKVGSFAEQEVASGAGGPRGVSARCGMQCWANFDGDTVECDPQACRKPTSDEWQSSCKNVCARMAECFAGVEFLEEVGGTVIGPQDNPLASLADCETVADCGNPVLPPLTCTNARKIFDTQLGCIGESTCSGIVSCMSDVPLCPPPPVIGQS